MGISAAEGIVEVSGRGARYPRTLRWHMATAGMLIQMGTSPDTPARMVPVTFGRRRVSKARKVRNVVYLKVRHVRGMVTLYDVAAKCVFLCKICTRG